MQASNKTVTGPAPQTAPTEQRVEVVIEQHEGAPRVALKYMTWTEGLGWWGQKTILLDVDQLDDLHRAITVARHRLTHQRAEAGEPVATAQVIRLPQVG